MITIREGSSLHYSLLWIDAESRQRFVTRLTLIQAISSTLNDVTESSIAQKKIHWWHEELERMATGAARHPATQACQTQLIKSNTHVSHNTTQNVIWSDRPAIKACLDLLSTVSTQWFTPPSTDTDRAEYLTQSYAVRMALLAHALSEQEEDLLTPSHPDSSALALGQHEQLAQLPQLIHQGQPVFSEAMYRQFDIKPADLAQHIRIAKDATSSANDTQTTVTSSASTLAGIPVVQDKSGRKAMLEKAIDEAQNSLNTALIDPAVIARYRCAPLLPLWRLLILREKQLRLWSQLQPDLLRERSTLTPIRKLYWAWRHRR